MHGRAETCIGAATSAIAISTEIVILLNIELLCSTT